MTRQTIVRIRFAAPVMPTASSVGTEQFGINVVANTSPAVGANPFRYRRAILALER